MRKYALIGATAVAVVFAGQALAQSAVVEIAPEQRTRIKEYVVKEKVKPVTVHNQPAHRPHIHCLPKTE